MNKPIPNICLVILAGFVMLSCESGTEPKPEPIPLQLDITGVSLSDSTLMSRYTSIFQCFYEEDTTNTEIRFLWKLEQADGTITDSLMEVDRFYWQAPSEPGTYEHSVKLVTEDGEPVSEEFPFSVNVSPWQELPQIHTLTGKLVFAKEVDGEYQIFSSNADGTNTRQLTHFESPHVAYSPAWSPDGSRIVFVSSKYAGTALPSLFVMNSDGSGLRLLFGNERAPLGGRNPEWSPNGTKIVYNTGSTWRKPDIYVFDLITEENTRITSGPGYNESPSWSPDGKRIIFSSDRDYAQADTMRYRKDLYIINSDGTGEKRLTNTGNVSDPQMGADFYTIIYSWYISGNTVHTLDLLSSKINKIQTGSTLSFYPTINKKTNELIVFGAESGLSDAELLLMKIDEGNNTGILNQYTIDSKDRGIDYKWYIGDE